MKCRFVEDQIEQGGVECLNDKEEDLFNGDVQDLGSHDHILGVAPYRVTDEVAVPRDCRSDGNGDQEEDFVDVEAGAQRGIEDGEEDGGRDGVGKVSGQR